MDKSPNRPAVPGGPPYHGPLGRAAAEAARAHSGVPLADRPHGDGHIAVFARASDAAACALAVQRALTADAGPARIAVHTSQAGYPGPGLDRCAALARVAWAGQVLLSRASAGVVAEGLPAGADLADFGLAPAGGPGTRRARVAAAPSGPARDLPAAAGISRRARP